MKKTGMILQYSTILSDFNISYKVIVMKKHCGTDIRKDIYRSVNRT
jgi:hypothetical protein